MSSTMDILAILKKEAYNIKQLADKLEVPAEQIKRIVKDLTEHNLLEYDEHTGQVRLPSWLINIEMEIENIKPAIGTIILPKNNEITIQNIAIGNFTDKDLELHVRLDIKRKEIAICNIG